MLTSLTIIPQQITIDINAEESILSAIRRQADLPELETPCNGKGYCGKCKVQVLSGHLSPLTPIERKSLTEKELKDGFRLACMTTALDDTPICITLPDRKKQAAVLDQYHLGDYTLNPTVGQGQSPAYGVAVDIGTTTIATVLLNLSTGEGIAKASCVNPQTRIGGDVLSRIEYTMTHEDGLTVLAELICQCLDELTLQLISDSGIQAKDIYGYSIAANTTMLHLLLSVDPKSIAIAPYTPKFTKAQYLPASKLGLTHCHPQATVYCLPSVSGYIGADIVAGIYMTGLRDTDKHIMFIDIGTNGEIVLSIKGELHSCSCAAGPALEGMNITCGMRAAEGAIEHVIYDAGVFQVKTIGNAPACGICGSGVLETMSALVACGAVEASGKFPKKLPPALEPYFVKPDGKKAYQIANGERPIYFSQADVRQVQLAKGAILSGFVALLEKNALTLDDLDEIIIAGQFGSYLNEDTLIGAGILPANAKGKVTYIGNSSLAGAILCLLDGNVPEQMSQIAKDVNYFELASHPDYTRLLMKCMSFSKM